jgi:hypothetical protein
MLVAFALFMDPRSAPKMSAGRIVAMNGDQGDQWSVLVWWLALRIASRTRWCASLAEALRGATNDNARPVVLLRGRDV